MRLNVLVSLAAIVIQHLPVEVTSEFMNDPNEVHAFSHGFYAAWFPTREWGKEYEKEIHYWRGGFMLGSALKLACFAGIGYLVGNVFPVRF